MTVVAVNCVDDGVLKPCRCSVVFSHVTLCGCALVFSQFGVATSVIIAMNQMIAGTVAGVAGIVVGQPLDTIKVRLQTDRGQYRGPLHCARSIVRHEGLRGFFKGVLPPIAANAPINAVLFLVHFQTYSLLEDGPAAAWHPLTRQFVAGCISGFSQVFLACPSELIKIQLQVQKDAAGDMNSLQCARGIVRQEGWRGLFRGLTWTLMRDVPAFGIYFWSYAWVKDHFVRQREERHWKSQQSRQPVITDSPVESAITTLHASPFVPELEPSLAELTFAGGMAGLFSFLFLHPIDVLKSLAQSIVPGSGKTLKDAMRESYKAEGSRYLLRGIVPTCLRAFPVSAVVFAVQENVVKVLSRR